MAYEVTCDMVLNKDGALSIGPSEAKLLDMIAGLEELTLLAKCLGMLEGDIVTAIQSLNSGPLGPLVNMEGSELSLTALGHDVLSTYRLKRRSLDEQLHNLWRKPWVTTDGVVLMDGKIVLIRRGRPPFEGMYALPGGIVEYGETVEDCAVREVREEIGLSTRVIGLSGVYSAPDRDPRGHFITVAFNLEVVEGSLRAGDDARDVALFLPEELPELAADHRTIIDDALRRRSILDDGTGKH